MSDEDGDRFDVLLTAVGSKKFPVVKVLRAATGMGLKDAVRLVDKAPSTLEYGVSKLEAETLKSELEGLGAVAELHASSAGVLAKTEPRRRRKPPRRSLRSLLPTFARSSSIKTAGSNIKGRRDQSSGQPLEFDSSGSMRVFRDTRGVFLLIEGPRVSIAAPLSSKGHTSQALAQKFAAKVNQLAMSLDGAKAANPPPQLAAPSSRTSSTSSSALEGCATRGCSPRRSSKSRSQRSYQTDDRPTGDAQLLAGLR